MKIHKEIEQGSQEWHDIRAGRMTASHADAIGNNGKGLETYVYKILAAKYSSAEPDNYTNRHMERGNDLEDVARTMYELENDVTVEQVGFVSLGEYAGCSPDGLIGKDGGIEIKSPEDVRHFKMLLNGEKEIDKKYRWQVQMNMLLTERKWWDLVFYNPNFERSMIVWRIEPDEEMFADLKKGLEAGTQMIQELEKKL